VKKIFNLILVVCLISSFNVGVFAHELDENASGLIEANSEQIKEIMGIVKKSKLYKELKNSHKINLMKNGTYVKFLINPDNPNVATLNAILYSNKNNTEATLVAFGVDILSEEVKKEYIMNIELSQNSLRLNIDNNTEATFFQNGKVIADNETYDSFEEYFEYSQAEHSSEVEAQGTVCDVVCWTTTTAVTTTVCGWVGASTFSLGWWACRAVTGYLTKQTCNTICTWEPDYDYPTTPVFECESPYKYSPSSGTCTYWGL
jgi:hypothetical protein